LKTPSICIFGQSLCYPEGGGHFWVYLNWALGFAANGCKVWWLDSLDPSLPEPEASRLIGILKARLAPYGLDDSLLLTSTTAKPLPQSLAAYAPEKAEDADLLLNFRYSATHETLRRFKSTALLDIDPGLFQYWNSAGQLPVQPHDFYFTIGETVGTPGSPIPDLGKHWHKVHPCVCLDQWAPEPAAPDAAFTTVTHWYSKDYVIDPDGTCYDNTKRAGFLPYAEVPKFCNAPLELVGCFTEHDHEDTSLLRSNGWRIRFSSQVCTTPDDYKKLIAGSLGEFSAVKRSCLRFQNAWISDRSVCFLAAGKPVIVEHTGPSAILPDASGIWRFRSPEDAVKAVNSVLADYQNQCAEARRLAETYFGAKANAEKILKVVL